MKLFRTKISVVEETPTGLRKCLSAFDLILLGVGAIVGAGIFVITGIAAATKAGPAVILSYGIAGFACAFAALAYAELASSIGGSGSAYSYAYAGLGEIIAWIIGWDLVLEYAVGACAVAIGWSGYVHDALLANGIVIPPRWIKSYGEGGMMNLPAALIILLLSAVVAIGAKQSARFNKIVVFIKISAILIFIAVASMHVAPQNWKPFMPFGWQGVAEGAALVFFAFIGFDAVSTAAEEAIKPQRDLAIGIIGSLVICTIIYMAVAALLTGIAKYNTLNVQSPVAQTILNLGHNFAAGAISVGAIAGLTSVILIFIYSMTRVFYAMSRDGLLPSVFSKLNEQTRTPVRTIIISGFIMALVSGSFSMAEIAELVNIGTLAAFIIVCLSVIILRYKEPNIPRPFKTPFHPLIPTLGIVMCGYLMLSLPLITWIRFTVWMGLGLVIYFVYSYNNSKLSPRKQKLDNKIS